MSAPPARPRWAGHLGLRAPDRPLLRYLAGSGDPVVQIALLAEVGFSGVQDNFLCTRSIEEQARIGAALSRHGLRMGSFVHDPMHWNAPRWSAEHEAGREMIASALDVSIAAAGRVGARLATCITGFDPVRLRDRQLRAMTQNLAHVAEQAQAAGLTLCVEVTNPSRVPDMLVERLDDALAMVEAVAHPAVALMFDVGHLAMNGEEPLAAIERARGWIAGVQAADLPDRIDLGAGRLDWPAILQGLEAAGYDGLIELEHEPIELSEAGERALLQRLGTLEAQLSERLTR